MAIVHLVNGSEIFLATAQPASDNNPVITILGLNPYPLTEGDSFTDPGATASDIEDGDLTSSIVIVSNDLDVNTPGSYSIVYQVTDSDSNTVQATRVINVSALPDTTDPVITLLGANPFPLTQGTAYSEPGFSAADNVDGDVTSNVQVTNNIDINTPGTYQVDYSVTDAAGNTGTAQRVVEVTALDVLTAITASLSVYPSTDVTWIDGEQIWVVYENNVSEIRLHSMLDDDGATVTDVSVSAQIKSLDGNNIGSAIALAHDDANAGNYEVDFIPTGLRLNQRYRIALTVSRSSSVIAEFNGTLLHMRRGSA